MASEAKVLNNARDIIKINLKIIPALQVPLQVCGSSHQDYSRHPAAMLVRTLSLQSRKLLMG